MVEWISALLVTVGLLFASTQVASPSQEDANTPTATTQPTTQPSGQTGTLRKPAQAEILRNLLRQQDLAKPIQPRVPGTNQPGTATQPATTETLMLEGTFLVERPGRLVYEGGKPKFVLNVDGDDDPTTLQILPSQLLETMEREAQAGFEEFIISAEVTRYRGDNYLLLRRVLRRVGHGNLAP